MRTPAALPLLAVLLLASPAFASYGDKPSMPQPGSTSGGMAEPQGGTLTPREEADRDYRAAWDDVERGSHDKADGKAASAKKRFQRALDRSREAVEHDSTYAEAWNLVGFTERQLGDYPKSFAAYRTALRLEPDFALAREYYGEGLLETGDLAGALAQLAWLRRIGDAKQAADLQAAVDRYRGAHPDSSVSTGSR
jgi:tetratricopeptide (TPR) repeat protein